MVTVMNNTKLCIPWTSFKDLLIWKMHASGLDGHFGRDKTITLVKDRFCDAPIRGVPFTTRQPVETCGYRMPQY